MDITTILPLAIGTMLCILSGALAGNKLDFLEFITVIGSLTIGQFLITSALR